MVMPRNRWSLKIGLDVGDQRGDAGMQCQDALCPVHEFHHFVAVEMLRRDRDGRQAKRQLQLEHQQDRDIAEAGRVADAGVE